MTDITIQSICARWRSLDRPLFKGSLIDDDGCCCAQGDVLRLSGATDDDLRATAQFDADKRVADLLDISITHSILLRQVNDDAAGCPQDVLEHPEKVLGDQAQIVLAFWRYLDRMDHTQWAAAGEAARAAAGAAAAAAAGAAAAAAAGAAAGEAAREAAREAALEAAWEAAGAAAWEAARAAAGAAAREAAWAAAWASNEIQGAAKLSKFHFLPMFGFASPAEIPLGR